MSQSETGVRLPLYSCPFRQCVTDDRPEFLLHIGGANSPHRATIDEVCPAKTVTKVRRVDYVLGAISYWERQQWPKLGLSVTRQALGTLAARYKDDSAKSFACFVFVRGAARDYIGARAP